MTLRGDALWDKPHLAGDHARNLRRAAIVRAARKRREADERKFQRAAAAAQLRILAGKP